MNNAVNYPNGYRNPPCEFEELTEVKGAGISETNLADIAKDNYEFEKLLKMVAQRSMEIARFIRKDTAELKKFLDELEGDEITGFVNGYNEQPYKIVNQIFQNHFNVR